MANCYSAFGFPLGTATIADRRGGTRERVSIEKENRAQGPKGFGVEHQPSVSENYRSGAEGKSGLKRASRLKNWTRVLRDRSEAIG